MKRAYLAMVASLVVLWVFVTAVLKVQTFLVPPPDLVLKALWDDRQLLLDNTYKTLSVGMVGYVIANVLGIVLAVSFYYVHWLEAFMNPWLVFITRIPFLVFSSIFVVMFTEMTAPKLIIVVLVTIFTIIANVSEGLKSAEPVLLDRMRVLNATRWQTFTNILWPAAMPYFIASQLIAFTSMVIAVIIAEYQYANDGLGFLLLRAQQQYRMDKLYAVALLVSTISVGIYIGIKSYQGYVARKMRMTIHAN